jgi:DNA topoisomerase-3
VVPTPAGTQLYELLRGAAPALVDPGTTAVWEMRLDDVMVGLARDKRATLPSGYDKDFDICRRFLDQHAGR